MTLDQLRYFLETAKTQHLNRAAQSLNISPSAVSSAIAALEAEFGCLLFTREGKAIRLTEKGEFLKANAEKLFDQTNAMAIGLRGEETTFTGTYKIAASHYLAIHILGRLLPSLQKKYQHLTLELGSLATYRVISDVLSGDLDAGLCLSPLSHPDLKTTEVYKGQLYLAARKNHPIFKLPANQQLKALSDYPAIMHKPVVGVDICDNHPMLAKFGINANIRCFWDSDDVAMRLIEESDCWTLFPDIVINENQKKLRAIEVPKNWDAPYTIAFIARAHRGSSSIHQLLIEKLTEFFRLCS